MNDEIWFVICTHAFSAPSLIAFKKLRLLSKKVLKITQNFNVFDENLIYNRFPNKVWENIFRIFRNDLDYNLLCLNSRICLISNHVFQPLISYGAQDKII